MVQTLSSCRTTIIVAAAALLVSANVHCAFEWQAALHHGSQWPIDQGCENESGCICRGAVVAQPVDAGCLAGDSISNLLELPPPILGSAHRAADHDMRRLGCHCLSPPLTGRQLRALYASLVI